MPVSQLVRTERTVPRKIVLFTVHSGDRIIVETVDAGYAARQRATWNKVTLDIFPPAEISATEFVEAANHQQAEPEAGIVAELLTIESEVA